MAATALGAQHVRLPSKGSDGDRLSRARGHGNCTLQPYSPQTLLSTPVLSPGRRSNLPLGMLRTPHLWLEAAPRSSGTSQVSL